MPQIQPINAIRYAPAHGKDISRLIAPPYDVLDEQAKAALLSRDPNNIVGVDLPHLPAKTVGPDATYEAAGQSFREMLADNVVTRQSRPAIFVYRQTFDPPSESGSNRQPKQPLRRLGLFTNIPVQPFGPSKSGRGGVFPHEQTFSGPKMDRLKLMRATKAQLSPIFGLCPDNDRALTSLLEQAADAGPPDQHGITPNDQVKHEIWVIDQPDRIAAFQEALDAQDVFIADGHHRYNTALNYQKELTEQSGPLPVDHPANFCLFVLVSMRDPGLFIGPTHRVVGGMDGFSLEKFVAAAGGRLNIQKFVGNNLDALEAALPTAGDHAMGLYTVAGDGSPAELSIATTTDPDPLNATHPNQSPPWRQLDVAIAQHLIVEQICAPAFAPPGVDLKWSFPHTVQELETLCQDHPGQLGLIMQATPLESVRKVSEAGELMPQKSTFFFPKVATGLVVNPLT